MFSGNKNISWQCSHYITAHITQQGSYKGSFFRFSCFFLKIHNCSKCPLFPLMLSITILVNMGDRNMQGGMQVITLYGEQGLSLSSVPQVFFQRYSCNVFLPYLIQLNFTSQYQQPSPVPGLVQQNREHSKTNEYTV